MSTSEREFVFPQDAFADFIKILKISKEKAEADLYFEIIRDDKNSSVLLKKLPTLTMGVNYNSRLEIETYYQLIGDTKINFKPDEILHIRFGQIVNEQYF